MNSKVGFVYLLMCSFVCSWTNPCTCFHVNTFIRFWKSVCLSISPCCSDLSIKLSTVCMPRHVATFYSVKLSPSSPVSLTSMSHLFTCSVFGWQSVIRMSSISFACMYICVAIYIPVGSSCFCLFLQTSSWFFNNMSAHSVIYKPFLSYLKYVNIASYQITLNLE